MKVNINKPEPVIQPPTTYDLIGLTAKQAELIYRMVCKISCTDAARLIGATGEDDTAYGLYCQMEALRKEVVSPRTSISGVLRLTE